VTEGRVRRLRDVGEHDWIRRWIRRLARDGGRAGVLIGPGDDAAVVRTGRRPLLVTTDTLLEDVHFRRGWLAPRDLGRRAFAVNASDLAAMGGVPRFALVALAAPARTPVAELDAVMAGFAGAARRAGARVVGGNLVAATRLGVTVALLGEAPGRIVTRAGARPGDVLFVTGVLGATGAAVRRLRAGHRATLPAPPDRARAAIALARVASAMIDLSDGLVQDAGHLCRASGVAAEIALARVPVARACREAVARDPATFAAVAGEDYELLATVPAARLAALARLRLGCPLTRIGRIVGRAVAGAPAVRLVDAEGGVVRIPRGGFDHFRSPPA
jgi:thiamine-monophosphate kinase